MIFLFQLNLLIFQSRRWKSKIEKIYSYELDNRVKQKISTILPLYAVSYSLHNKILYGSSCSKLHRISIHMKIAKNTLRQKKITMDTFWVDTLYENAYTQNIKNLVIKRIRVFVKWNRLTGYDLQLQVKNYKKIYPSMN